MLKFSTAIKTLVLLAASVGSAQAATINVGNLYEKSFTFGQTYAKGESFSDHYIFDISPDSSYAAIATTLNLDPYFSINGMTISLSGNGMTPVSKIFQAGETIGKLEIGKLDAGMGYDFNVSGIATGNFGGSYAGVLAAAAPAPVPVPAAAWLLGSGLLGLAGIARRKGASC